MKQMTLASTGFEKYGKTTRRVQFLADMERVEPWAELCTLIEPVYPKAGPEGGRPTVPLERMLRIYFLQQRFNLSDPWGNHGVRVVDFVARRRHEGFSIQRSLKAALLPSPLGWLTKNS